MNLTKNYSALLLILWFCLSPAIVFSCTIDPIVKQERKIGEFSGIKVGGAFKVYLSQTGIHKLVLEGEEDLLDQVQTEIRGDVLYIDLKRDWSWKNNQEVTVHIDFDQLNKLEVSGAAELKGNTPIKVGDLDLRVSGAGDLDLEVEAEALDVTVSGAGDVHLSGSTERQEIRLSGAGDYKAQELKSNYTHAKASGAGSVVVYVKDEIEAYASGAGSVKYYGKPDKERTSSSGAGDISRK